MWHWQESLQSPDLLPALGCLHSLLQAGPSGFSERSAAVVSRSRSLELRVPRLQPSPCPAADVAGADAVGDHAFAPQCAGMARDEAAVSGAGRTELDALA